MNIMAPSKLMWESPLTPLDSMVEAMLFSNSNAIEHRRWPIPWRQQRRRTNNDDEQSNGKRIDDNDYREHRDDGGCIDCIDAFDDGGRIDDGGSWLL